MLLLLGASPVLLFLYLWRPSGYMYLYSLVATTHQSHSLMLAFAVIEMAFNYWSLTIVSIYFCFWAALVFQHLIWLDELLE